MVNHMRKGRQPDDELYLKSDEKTGDRSNHVSQLSKSRKEHYISTRAMSVTKRHVFD